MTADSHQRQDDMVCLPQKIKELAEFESLLEQAACPHTNKYCQKSPEGSGLGR